MKFSEVTLEDIKDFFDNSNHDYEIFANYNRVEHELVYDDNNTKVLDIFRFDGEIDDEVYVCGIYKDRYGDIVILTENARSSLNHGEGWLEDEDDDISIEELVSEIMTNVKADILEEIDFQKRQIDFLHDFAKHNKLYVRPVNTSTGNKYE